MTEQQEHLSNLFKQRQALTREIESLTNQGNVKKEIFLKVQGAIEYLQQIGVTLPETEIADTPSEVPVAEVAQES
jgi:hypothetical protein